MKHISILILLFSCFFFHKKSSGQDMQFTQFYAAPIYLNPAFTGLTIEHRFAMNYRKQWAAIPGGFNNFSFSYDYNLSDINSGIGMLVTNEKAGSGGLRQTDVSFTYAYHFRTGPKTYIQPGIYFGYVTKSIDFSKLIFNDQLYTGNSITSDSYSGNNIGYFDIGVGALIFNPNFYFGFSVKHLNKPNESLTNNESLVPIKTSIHSGVKIKLESNGIKNKVDNFINLAFHYKYQAKFDQVDIGIYYNRTPFSFGFWYRGIPLLKAYQPGLSNNDALAAILGYEIPDRNLKFGYSYDFTISRLASRTAGSHEISVIYEVASKKKKRKSKRFFVPCAKF